MFRVIAGVIVFGVFVYLGLMFSGCADGWHSPSIGHRGACSYHGGVSRLPILFDIAGIAAGIYTYIKLTTLFKR